MTKKQKTDELTPEEVRELEQLEKPAGTAGDWGTAEEKPASSKDTPKAESFDDRKKRLAAELKRKEEEMEELENALADLEEAEYLAQVQECAAFLEARGVLVADVSYYLARQNDPKLKHLTAAGAPWGFMKFSSLANKATGTGTAKTTAPKKAPAPPKFKNPATGETHSGRGQLPAWLKEARDAGKLEEFRIK